MPSYQDIDTRLDSVERKLDFVMKTMRMKAMIQSKVLDVNGNAQTKALDASLLDLFHLSNQMETTGKFDPPTIEDI